MPAQRAMRRPMMGRPPQPRRPLGRPPDPSAPGHAETDHIDVRLTPEIKTRIYLSAVRQRLNLSSWMKRAALAQLEREDA